MSLNALAGGTKTKTGIMAFEMCPGPYKKMYFHLQVSKSGQVEWALSPLPSRLDSLDFFGVPSGRQPQI